MRKVIPDSAREKIIEWTNPFVRIGEPRGLGEGGAGGSGRDIGEGSKSFHSIHFPDPRERIS